MAGRINRTIAGTFLGRLTLADLRYLVESTADLAPNAPVDIETHHAVDQRDDSYTNITIQGA